MSSFLSSLASGLGLGGSGAASIDVAELHKRLAAKEVPVLVDVRSPAEFAGGHVAEAINIPLGEVSGAPALEAYRGGDVYLICQSGGRSGSAQSTLNAQGFTTINVRGGTGGWRAAGYPVSTAR